MQLRRKQIRAEKRRGVALLVAIVCVSIAVAVMYGIVQLATQAYREVGLEQHRTQASWILESAVDRAAAQLAAEEDYRGEKWTLEAQELGGRYDAEVTIQVERVEGQADWRQVRVVADYPVDIPYRVRQTRTFRIRLHP